ncbi:DUF6455 family protein [Roseicyclus elongatus]|nr:DUF6455 family protein [Roseibacterium elongatum]
MTGTTHKLGDTRRHYWLAVGMADISGADLQRALEEGRITHGDWAGMVERCRGCNWADGCDCWMQTQSAGEATVPRACPNAEMFDAVIGSQSDA